jgi:hypothetical protein
LKKEELPVLKFAEKHTVSLLIQLVCSFNTPLLMNMTLIIYLELQHEGELKYYKDMAMYVKHEMEKRKDNQGSWHVIVGKK